MKGLLPLFRLLIPLSPFVVVPLFIDFSPPDDTTAESATSSSSQRSPFFESLRWQEHLKNRPSLTGHHQALLKLSDRLPLEKFTSLSIAQQDRLAAFASRRLDPNTPFFSICWEPGVAPEVMEAFHAVDEMAAEESDTPGPIAAATQFNEGDRWGRTATFNSFFEFAQQGRPTTLRWSFMPDGTSIFGFNDEPTSDSDLISFLDARYGVTAGGSDLTTRPWFTSFQDAFDNISNFTGITYVYEPNDDGANLTQSSSPSGSIGTRGDIRIGGHFIDGDGGSNTLAYNFFPSSGDMVIDTGNISFYGNTSNNSINLRNVVEHEHCHGLGLSHVCPVNQTKLMEPAVTSQFRGIQLDDIFSLNRLYGDFFEKHNSSRNNDSIGNAAPLPVVVDSPYQRDHLSIDDNSDTDFYSIESVPANTFITCRVTPPSTPSGFVEGPQNANGSCSAGSSFDFTNIHDLSLTLIASDGNTVLATANSQPLGQPEEILAFQAPSSGDYYLRVTGGSTNNTQLYNLEVSVSNPPATPTNLAAQTTTSGQVSLSWTDNSSNETGFQIERKLESDGTWAIYDTAPIDSVSYQDLAPPPGINLFYRVSAIGSGLNSDPTNEAIAMVVDLSASSYLYDFGGTQSPIANGAFRVSRQTAGDISWSAAVTSRDRGGSDSFNRDYLFSDESRAWSHRIANGVWEVNIRQGDEDGPREDLTISAEGILQAENIASAANEFVESTFLVEVSDDSLDLTFDDLGGTSDRWIVNRVSLNRLSPYRTWAFLENIPSAFADPTQDADNDGILNIQEYYFGLSPLSPSSAPLITSGLSQDGSNYLFTFSRDPSAVIDSTNFETSIDLSTWNSFTPSASSLSITPNGSLEEVTLTLPATTVQGFIRLGLQLTE